ncbi:hypothetical protein MKZ38_009004 [Zalerion maritima]|uniref:Dockerin type 1 n=1 Tax=Zalerion maritima TaxID=339359 RepID=A0AAD5RHH5_9PEZI|nr:hypothetical protein MKZ38_009004 [Zalerion maritima]
MGKLQTPRITILGPDPAHRTFLINGSAFQQQPICTHRGWQYATWYSARSSEDPEPLFVHLARRKLEEEQAWETIVFDDYPQTTDDGHNTIQMGIAADGTIHLSYDHHCDVIRYRHSGPGVASNPDMVKWAKPLFTKTLDHIPGLDASHENFGYVSYPRFVQAGDVMFLTFRTGKAGLGDDLLYVYQSKEDRMGEYKYLGTNIHGVQNNPYIHGLDYKNGALHASWVWRGFVEYPGWDDPLDTKHKQQAGPNGAENNYDICYAYSDDDGVTWKNGLGETIADMRKGESISPSSPGITALEIPKGSGLTNQESQVVDNEGRVFVLNRDHTDGPATWNLYWRSVDGKWTRQPITLVAPGKRGQLAMAPNGDVLLVLPDVNKKQLKILRATKRSAFSVFEELWCGDSYWGEPLVDHFGPDNSLSVFAVSGNETKRDVVVLDFDLE